MDTNGNRKSKYKRPLRILTWHVHGSYLYYLVQSQHEFYLPVKPGRPEGYGGKAGSFPWPENVHEVPADQVKDLQLDCILYQSRRNYSQDQFEILADHQLRLPKLYLEHDPPREHPTDTRHVVDNPNVLLVQVTHFNDLMWDSGRTPTRVIEHGVLAPEGIHYTGELARGLVVVNGLASRGRRLGSDIFTRLREQIALDLVGMGSTEIGGLGEVAHHKLAEFSSRYRFFFNPIRYTSLGLAVLEAMMLGMPVVGLATTEMSVTIQNGVSGYIDTNVERLADRMQELLDDPAHAYSLGQGARRHAQEKHNIHRFISDWNEAFYLVIENGLTQPATAQGREVMLGGTQQ
jgi:glycosyltransferase involved in cell wall biosynthesis